jgi:hypothetical protein
MSTSFTSFRQGAALAALAVIVAGGCSGKDGAGSAAGADAGNDGIAGPMEGGSALADGGSDSDADAGASQYVGGTVAGLAAGSVVLQNNGGDDLTVSKNGTFTFATSLARNTSYDVKVTAQPPGQSCAVKNGSGTVSTSDVTNIEIACQDDMLSCPAGSTGTKQTICGQLYDLKDGARFQADTSCAPCASTPTGTGPCSLKITAYDALSFAMNPAGAPALAAAETFLDTCGRYRMRDVDVADTGSTFLVIDDASSSGATGNTVPVAIAVASAGATATMNVEAWIVASTTTGAWEASGGPALSGGIYFPIFRAHADKPGVDRFANQAGVTVTKYASPIGSSDYYFGAAALVRTTIDAVATSTGANGSGIVTGASLLDGTVYSGNGGLADAVNCRWETKAGASMPAIVFVQVFRPTNQVSKTCPL